MAKEKRLGRGLEALLNRVDSASRAAENTALPQNPLEEKGADKQSTIAETAAAKSSAPMAAVAALTSGAAAPQMKTEHLGREERALLHESAQVNELKPFENIRLENEQADNPQTDTVYYLDINDIDANPYQPRQDFNPDEINQLASSLQEHGLLQALVVRQKDDGRYELVSGERRLRAALQVGWQQIPAMVIEADDREMAELSLVENLHRKDLNAIEKAVSFHNYLKQYKCKQEELSRRLSLDRSTIANLIRLLDLPDSVQQMVLDGSLSATHARALLPLGEEKLQNQFAQRIVREKLSAHEVEDMIRDFLAKEEKNDKELTDPEPVKPTHSANQLAELEQQFLMKTGMKVKLSQSTGGRGKITINFKNHEQFELIQNILMSAAYPAQEKSRKKKAA